MNYVAPENLIELIIGWFVTATIMIWMPIGVIWKVRKAEGSNLKEKIITAFSPHPRWGPYLERHRSQASHLEMLQQIQSFSDLNPTTPEKQQAPSRYVKANSTSSMSGMINF